MAASNQRYPVENADPPQSDPQYSATQINQRPRNILILQAVAHCFRWLTSRGTFIKGKHRANERHFRAGTSSAVGWHSSGRSKLVLISTLSICNCSKFKPIYTGSVQAYSRRQGASRGWKSALCYGSSQMHFCPLNTKSPSRPQN
jgi:hypothetical protein